jgi:hypothetical protein
MHLVIALLLGAAAPDADARARANERLQAGNAAMEQGAADRAIVEYEAAYEAFASPKVLYNLARAYEAAGRLAQACATFERFTIEVARGDAELREALADRVASAHEAIAGLRPRVAHLAVSVAPADASLAVDGQPPGAPSPVQGQPWSVWLVPGDHEVSAEKTGFSPERRRLWLDEGQPVELALQLRPIPPPPASTSADVTAKAPPPSPPEPHRSHALWWTIAAGTVVAASVTGVWLATRHPCTAEGWCY